MEANKLQYHRSVRLHEAGHAVVAEMLIPGLVKSVSVGGGKAVKIATFPAGLEEDFMRKGMVCNGTVAYHQLTANPDDRKMMDAFVTFKVAMTLAGVEFQTMEGYEPPDFEMTMDAEAKLVEDTIRRYGNGDQKSLDQGMELLARLTEVPAVKACVAHVADMLESGEVGGDALRRTLRDFGLEIGLDSGLEVITR